MISARLNKKEFFSFFIACVLSLIFIFLPCVQVSAQCTLVFDPSSPLLADGSLGNYYSVTFSATGGSFPLYFSLSSGSVPPGLTFSGNYNYATLSGNPDTTGTYTFTVSATDYYSCNGSQTYTLKIEDPCTSLTISPPTLPVARLGAPYSQTLTISGGSGYYYMWGGDVGMPPGMDFDFSSGVISGTPTEAGTWDIYVYYMDSMTYCSGEKIYLFTVRADCPPIDIHPITLPQAVLDAPYYQQLSASGGSSPYTYYITSGSLPAGITFNSGGLLSGTPSSPGSFNFVVTAVDSVGCRGQISYALRIGCQVDTGSLTGYVGISGDDGASFYPLDGSSISGTVTARGPSGQTYSADLGNGFFSFGQVPAGTYTINAVVDYPDHILYDANLLDYGCAAPSQKPVTKRVELQPRTVSVACDSSNIAYIVSPPPVVMIHGSFGCYSKWYSDDDNDPEYPMYYDNYARSLGIVSFTPNYDWWSGSWTVRTQEILDQLGRDFSSLTSGGIPPYVIIAHDMGGLAVRVMGSTFHADSPIVGKIRKAYLLGVPNSGADYSPLLGNDSLLGPNSVIRYFNEAYPDFGPIAVYSVAGNHGWWNTSNNDGFVSTGSVFNIRRVACRGEDCIVYPAVRLGEGESREMYYDHSELGSPSSTSDVFAILLSSREGGNPEAPVGGVEWGTVGHTSTVVTNKAGALRSEALEEQLFTVSKCDGIAVHLTVTSGSGDFSLSDPSGFAYEFTDGWFVQTAPEAGQWKFRVTPGPSGVSFKSSIVENSIFGISAYLTSEYLPASGKTMLVLEKTGDWSLAIMGNVTASLYDDAGTFLGQYVLVYDGNRYYTEIIAGPNAENCQLIIKAEGTYNGKPFTRVEFESLNVLGPGHLFTGEFSDSPSDLDGDGRYDAVSLTAGLSLSGSGNYVVSADLFDAKGNFVSHASAMIGSEGSGSGQASLVFPLTEIACGQLGSPLEVSGLKLLDAADLTPLDVWSGQVLTAAYPAGQFTCSPGNAAPRVYHATPPAVTAGTTVNIAVTGKNFDDAATIVFESGIGPMINVLESKVFENRVIFASLVIPSSAVGQTIVKIVNPDGKTGTLSDVFLSIPDAPPSIRLENPAAGAVVGGVLDVTANASDDVKVESVSFELDGVAQATVSSFPFIWTWDTLRAGAGSHQIKLSAADSSGQVTSVVSEVKVVRAPSVSSIGKKSDPFRFVVNGADFQQGVEVYIDGRPWTNIRWKNSSRIVIKGGASLKTAVPKGKGVTVTLVNPDGGSTSFAWSW